MTARQGGHILNAQGEKDEAGTLGKRSAWMEYGGEARPGEIETISIVDDEDNPRHPTPWHCRDDGWFGPAFTREAPFVIRPNEALSLRYLLVFRSADVNEAEVQTLTDAVREIADLVMGI
jgi:hypothetical protein